MWKEEEEIIAEDNQGDVEEEDDQRDDCEYAAEGESEEPCKADTHLDQDRLGD